MKKINIIIIIVFFIMLTFPVIDMNTGITRRIENSENRNKKEFPEFHLDRLLTFPAEFDLYFSDNFGARDLMFKLYSGFKYYFLKVSPLQEKVVIGDDSWLFLGNSFNKVIDKTIGLKKLSKNELQKISENIDSNWNALNRMGISYYIAVPPDKHSVYNDRLPYWCRTSHPDNLFKSVQAYVDSALNFKIIDLKEYINEKKKDELLFFKTSSHWNQLGAFYAYQQLMKILHQDYPELKILELGNYSIDTMEVNKLDLSNILNLNIKEETAILNPLFTETASLIEEPVPDFIHFDHERKDAWIRYRNPMINNLKVLIFRDSFTTAMLPYLKESFGESLFIWDIKLSKKLIEQEKPDIIIQIIAERTIDQLSVTRIR